MAVRDIIIYPDARLRQETTKVGAITDDIRQLVADLTDTMYAAHGAGIAAIQIGRLEKLFLIEARVAGKAENDPPLVFINPEVIATSAETETAEEGCLSFPEIYVQVERPLSATVRATNLSGEVFEVEGQDLFARALLHEGDHLTGKILSDYMGPLKREMVKRKLRRNARDAAKAL